MPINLREYPKLPMQKSLTKFILGGAQLGIPNYGITNQGTYDALHVKKLIQVAYDRVFQGSILQWITVKHRK